MATESAPLRLVGLCAAWCGVCREFEPAFRALAAAHPEWQAVWLDVEEPSVSDALGELDIDTFPTVALGCGQRLLFWGEILPHAAVLQRLLAQHAQASGGQGSAGTAAQARAWRALWALRGG